MGNQEQRRIIGGVAVWKGWRVVAVAGLLTLAGCGHKTAAGAGKPPSSPSLASASAPSPSLLPLSPSPSPVATRAASPSPFRTSSSPRPSPAPPVTPRPAPSPSPTGIPMGSGTVITTADEGQTITLARGAVAYLELSGGLNWGEPTVAGNAVTLTPVTASPLPPQPGPATEPGIVASGTQEWRIAAVATGQAMIRDSGGPICPTGPMIACPMFIEEFVVTIDVV